MKTITATSSTSYHSVEGYVHIIPRPRLTLSDCMGKPRLWHGRGYCDDIWIDKLVREVRYYIVRLGCGTLLRCREEDLHCHDGRRWTVDFEDMTIIDKLPAEMDLSHLPAFEF